MIPVQGPILSRVDSISRALASPAARDFAPALDEADWTGPRVRSLGKSALGNLHVSLLAAILVAATPTSADPVLDARLNQVVDKALAEKRIVGTVILVAKNGEIVYRRAAGQADRETGTPMREDAIFRLASITKPIVTAAAMRMVEDGRLALDAPVTRWLPDFRPAMADGTKPEITVRQLVTHTSGLGYTSYEQSDGPYHKLNVSDGLDQPGLSLEENLRRLSAAPLNFEPGTSFLYGLSIDVLGGVLEKIEGRSLDQIVREKVTGPLGLKDTDFALGDTARLAVPYVDGKPEPVPMKDGMSPPIGKFTVTFAPSRIFDSKSYPSGGAAMVGTAPDVLRFLEAMRKGGAPILEKVTFETMAKDQVGPQAKARGPGWGFGYGWAVLSDPKSANTPQAAGTLQWGGIYGHTWFIDRENALTVVILTNTAYEGSGPFSIAIRNAVYN